MFSYLQEWFSDPRGMLIFFLLAFPGRMLAISAHECAHAWVADRCGDPTARLMGRVTLNPLRHLDPIGFIMMMILGFGWAKPVPVNPLNYKNYRKDDIKVSLAGVTTNLLLFLVGCILIFSLLGCALGQMPKLSQEEIRSTEAPYFIADIYGERSVFMEENGEYFYMSVADTMENVLYMSEYLIEPVFGKTVGYLYEMLTYFVITNLVLCVFNLIPIPPLDGYHVLNDLALKRPLFADVRAQMMGNVALYVIVFSGMLNQFFDWVETGALHGAAQVFMRIFSAIGLM